MDEQRIKKDSSFVIWLKFKKNPNKEETSFLDSSFLFFIQAALIMDNYSLSTDFLELKLGIISFISCLQSLLKFVEKF